MNTFLSIHIGTDILSNCDVVLTGTNSTEAFINGSDLKANTIIVDLAVPGNVDVASLVNSQTYIKGGIIELPIIDGQPQALKSAIFPLEPGESYACMAETMGLALVDYKGCHLTGDIDVQSVAKVSELLKNEGFLIKRYKVTDNM